MKAVTGPGQKRGWCPGFWTPMQSGDGLIVRLRVGVTGLRSAQLRALAQLSRAHGNALMELTRRANLQLRGVREDSLSVLQAKLVGLGLGAATPQDESHNALLVNPLAGLDARCTGLEPVGMAIDRVLATFENAASLPSKFGIVLEVDGPAAMLSHVSADIRVALCTTYRDLCHVSVGASQQEWFSLGSFATDRVDAVIARLMHALAQFNARGERVRMRDMLAADGGEALSALVGDLRVGVDREHASPPSLPLIGFHAGLRNWFGIGVPFGSASAETWLAIAALAEQFGTGAIRVAPTRSVLLLDVSAGDSARLADAARQQGLLVERNDPLLNVVACSGAPACGAAFGETRDLARTLGSLVPRLLADGARLHVSGCSKSCASSGVSDITVVHAADGCRLGFSTDVAGASLLPIQSIEAIALQLPTFQPRGSHAKTFAMSGGR